MRFLKISTETFRFEDENDYEYEIWFKVFRVLSKNRHPKIIQCTFFFSTEKLALLTVITVEGVKPSPDRKIKKNS